MYGLTGLLIRECVQAQQEALLEVIRVYPPPDAPPCGLSDDAGSRH